MLGHPRGAHDGRDRACQHARLTGSNTRKVLAHQARRRIGFDDRCARKMAQPIRRFSNRVVRTSRDAITTSRAPSQELKFVDRTGGTEDGNRGRSRMTMKLSRRDRINVDAADTARCRFRQPLFNRFWQPRHERRDLRRRNQLPQPTLQQGASAWRRLGGPEQECANRTQESNQREAPACDQRATTGRIVLVSCLLVSCLATFLLRLRQWSSGKIGQFGDH